ncbi:RNA polymerase sigma-70 factor [Pedobacter sp. MC2016-05]|uniref:RNA polymerase sigma factor n=1 Tax=Pedobacter sp. MC2016-05 TaxID=2994474 RepID=UPI00224561C8|nr:RNA polymerase sigma-70 factor [Pedobacter sp. MC2016-05]MCX2475359.1 RNA polymerase sigma-70 factor [Pedobacter sp. MC2016-05]
MSPRPLPDEKRILNRISAGDQNAFKLLYDHYQPMVFSRALYLLKSETLAEEVLQDVMLKLWLNASNLKENSNLAAFLTTLTRNRSFQLLRRKVLEAKTAAEMGKQWKEHHNETEENILVSDIKEKLQEGVSLLPPQQKMVYDLCRNQGYKYEQAAAMMNLSVETVKAYMKLALRFLRAHLKKNTDAIIIAIIFKLF